MLKIDSSALDRKRGCLLKGDPVGKLTFSTKDEDAGKFLAWMLKSYRNGTLYKLWSEETGDASFADGGDEGRADGAGG